MLIKAEVCMKFYDDNKLLYLETDVSGIGLQAALLQLRDDTSCQTHMVPDNTILCPIAFVSKSLMGAWSADIVILNARHLVSYMAWKNSTIIALVGKCL